MPIAKVRLVSPGRGHNALSIVAERSATLRIAIVNAQGKIAASIMKNVPAAGSYSIPLGNRLGSGAYWVTVTVGSGAAIQRTDTKVVLVN
jgi:hypothetical protein